MSKYCNVKNRLLTAALIASSFTLYSSSALSAPKVIKLPESYVPSAPSLSERLKTKQEAEKIIVKPKQKIQIIEEDKKVESKVNIEKAKSEKVDIKEVETIKSDNLISENSNNSNAKKSTQQKPEIVKTEELVEKAEESIEEIDKKLEDVDTDTKKPDFSDYYAPSAKTNFNSNNNIKSNSQNTAKTNKLEIEQDNFVSNNEDGSFREALIATYENNPQIIASRKAFEASGEDFNESLAGWLPTINANYSKGRRRNRINTQDWQYLDAQEKRLNATQPLIRIDTYFALDQANSIIKQSGAQLMGVTQQVLLESISRYLDVVRDREILMLNRNNVSVLKQQLDATTERFDLGEATKTDLSQSKARLARAEADAIQAMGNLAITESAFTRIVGFKPATDFSYPRKVPVIPNDMEQIIEKSLLQNPDLLVAKYAEEAADDGVSVNATRLLPTASLQGTMSRQEGSFLGTFDSDELLLNVEIPLYQGGADYARVRRAKKIKSQRRYETIEATNRAREEAITAWENYQTTLAAIESQKINIRSAEIALDGVKQEQLYGSRTVLDVLDAEQELFIARVNMERSERDLLVALYSILDVIGQLSPATLALGVKEYDQVEAISDIKYQLIGF